MSLSLKPHDLSDAALLVIDMQKGFCSEDGGLARAGVNMQRQRAIIPGVKELIGLCRQATIPIFWSQQVHFEHDATRKRHRIPTHMAKRNLDLCFAGTEDVEIAAELSDSVMPEDHVFEKHRASCFFDTTLDTKLRMLGVSIVIVSGVNSNYCVDSTVRDAYFRDYDVLLVNDCIACSFEDLHLAFLKNFERYFGESLSLDEFNEFVKGYQVGP